MNKTLSLATLATAMALLTACGDRGSTPDESATTDTTTGAATEQPMPADSATTGTMAPDAGTATTGTAGTDMGAGTDTTGTTGDMTGTGTGTDMGTGTGTGTDGATGTGTDNSGTTGTDGAQTTPPTP